MRSLVILLALAVHSFAAGPLILGVRGGLPFNDNSGVATVASGFGGLSASQRYEIGPTAGIRLPLGFSVEGDALFTRQSLNFEPFAGISGAGIHSDAWQFPVLLKFTAGRQSIAPVLGAGVTVRHINDFGSVPSYLFNTTTSSNTVGFVAAAGLRLKFGPVEVTPEVRYTRWGGDNFAQSLASFLPLSRNEGSVLVGITF